MDDSSVEVRDLLNALMDKSISAEEQGIDKAGDREISMALFGMLHVICYDRKTTYDMHALSFTHSLFLTDLFIRLPCHKSFTITVLHTVSLLSYSFLTTPLPFPYRSTTHGFEASSTA